MINIHLFNSSGRAGDTALAPEANLGAASFGFGS